MISTTKLQITILKDVIFTFQTDKYFVDTVHTSQEEIFSFLKTNYRMWLLNGDSLNTLEVYVKLNFQMNCSGG